MGSTADCHIRSAFGGTIHLLNRKTRKAETLALGAVETQMLRKIVTEAQFPKERTMEPMEVARVIADCIDGDLRYTSGEVIFLHK